MAAAGYRFTVGLWVLALPLLPLSLGGCMDGYYWQAARGQVKLLVGREPIEYLLAREGLEPRLRARLELAQAALAFAHEALLLPDNGSYTHYYDTGGRYLVWNVMAAPEFSLTPTQWCFPVAGCVSYRGYFAERDARRFADAQRARGQDVYIGGVAAYSTLGRFKDPILNTMLARSDDSFVALIFHELAHQKLYVQDGTAFNEGFATALEQIGLARWRVAQGLAPTESDPVFQQQRRAVLALFDTARARLSAVYHNAQSTEEKRRAKVDVLADTAQAYQRLMDSYRQQGVHSEPYAGLIRQGLNNASLASVGAYQDLAPAFRELARVCQQRLPCFYRRAEQLSKLTPEPRSAELERLRRHGERLIAD